MAEESFELIERKINDLVQIVDALKKDKANLAEEVSRMEGETKELTKKLSELMRERGEVKDRVERILSRLDAIEL